MIYTSGTTGRPKGAQITVGNLTSNLDALHTAWGWRPEDVLLHALPIFHTHGLFVALNVALVSGASVIFLPKFDCAAIMDQMPRATTMMGVPTFYSRLLGEAGFDPVHVISKIGAPPSSDSWWKVRAGEGILAQEPPLEEAIDKHGGGVGLDRRLQHHRGGHEGLFFLE